MSSTPPKTEPVARALALLGLALSWVAPGAGFMLVGRWRRGLLHFVTIVFTFACGLALHSSVAWPIWAIRNEDFNLINNLTFLVQLGSGLPALASLWASVQASGHAPAWLAGIPQHPYYELGSYYLIVAGALNIFAVGNFYDRIVRLNPDFEPQELGDAPGGEAA